MKAAVCREFGKPLTIEDVHLDSPQAGEVRVQVKACGICQSDTHSVEGAWGGVLPAIFGLNLGRVGGLLEAKKIAGMAEAHYAQIAPHLYCGPVVGAANIQLSSCSPNFLLLEGIERWDGFHAEILKTPIQWHDGYVIPPATPGLGVELDEEVAARHPYEGDELHQVPVYGSAD